MSNIRTIDIERFSDIFKALSNPNRLRIFMRLMSCCEPGTSCTTDGQLSACVGELGQDVNIVPSTVSHHLKELHRAGLIQMERRGQKVCCWIDSAALEDMSEFFTGGSDK